jgi:hypothetical protein
MPWGIWLTHTVGLYPWRACLLSAALTQAALRAATPPCGPLTGKAGAPSSKYGADCVMLPLAYGQRRALSVGPTLAKAQHKLTGCRAASIHTALLAQYSPDTPADQMVLARL